MVDVLIAGIVAMVISIVAGPRFISYLQKKEYGQPIREEGPAGARGQAGHADDGRPADPLLAPRPVPDPEQLHDPGADGLLLHGRLRRDRLPRRLHQGHAPALARPERPLEAARLLALITAVVGWVAYHRDFSTDLYFPGFSIPLSWAWYPFLFLIIAGAANGVNLTDGVDGLAAGTGIIAIFTFTAMTVIAFIRSGAARRTARSDLDLVDRRRGADRGAVGFLWYNALPAEVFMGDTGSMAIGGALAGFAIMTKTEVLLLFVGGIFLIEALSVIIQVFTFKYLGRRVFLMAPIHHHFEMKAWSETKIMVRFWILTAILCACGFALYYRYYFRFFRGG